MSSNTLSFPFGGEWKAKLKAGEVLVKDDEGIVEYSETALTVKVKGKRYRLHRPIPRGAVCDICVCSGDHVRIQYSLFTPRRTACTLRNIQLSGD